MKFSYAVFCLIVMLGLLTVTAMPAFSTENADKPVSQGY